MRARNVRGPVVCSAHARPLRPRASVCVHVRFCVRPERATISPSNQRRRPGLVALVASVLVQGRDLLTTDSRGGPPLGPAASRSTTLARSWLAATCPRAHLAPPMTTVTLSWEVHSFILVGRPHQPRRHDSTNIFALARDVLTRASPGGDVVCHWLDDVANLHQSLTSPPDERARALTRGRACCPHALTRLRRFRSHAARATSRSWPLRGVSLRE